MNMNFCPICGSVNLDEGDYENNGDGMDIIYLSKIYHCENCKNTFKEVQEYRLKETKLILEK